jgi:hypothetical protein
MSNTDSDRQIEFVCDRCLHSVMAADTGPWPRCPRGHGRLTPDDVDTPKAPPRQRVVGRLRCRAPSRTGGKAAAA